MGIKLGSITELATGLLGSYKIPYTTGAITRLLRLDTLADWVVQTATSFVPSGTGATSTTVQAELRTWFRPEQFGALGDGITDDTTAWNNAITAASASGSGVVVGTSGKTYLVGVLTPKANVKLQLYGVTMKLKDSTNWIMFDGTSVKSPYSRNFHIEGGTFNLNKAANFSANQSAGFVWFCNWQECSFKNITLTNAFRSIFNLTGCEDFEIDNFTADSCGANTGGFFSYGLEALVDGSANPCRRIHVRNFKVSTHWGFGIHWQKAEDCTAHNILFDTFTKGGASIGVTWTQAKRIAMSNLKCNSIDGDNLECNASEDITLDNVSIVSAGVRPLIFGDNGTGVSNDRVSVRNLKTATTGGSASISVDYLSRASFEHCVFDKTLTLTSSNPRNSVRFRDCNFAIALPANALAYPHIYHTNTVFTDWTLQSVEVDMIQASMPCQVVNNAAVLNVDMTKFVRVNSPGTGNGGLLEWTTSNTGTYASGSRQRLEFYHNDTTLNISAITNPADGSSARQFTAAADAANRRIQLTNGTGVNCNVAMRVTVIAG